MSSLLIIGGGGFFGQSFLDYFNKKSFQKWGIDNIYVTSRTIKKYVVIKQLSLIMMNIKIYLRLIILFMQLQAIIKIPTLALLKRRLLNK